jgi:mannose-1-phosphate guanylyltransferase
LKSRRRQLAAGYLKSGGYFWNSGMFIFKISVFLDAVQQFAPELYAGLQKIESADWQFFL